MSRFSLIFLILSGLPTSFLSFIISSFTPYTVFSSLPFSSLAIFALVPINIRKFIAFSLPCSATVFLFFSLHTFLYGFSRDLIFFYIATLTNLFLFVQSCLLRGSYSKLPFSRIIFYILFLLIFQSLGYLLAPPYMRSQVFSGQFIPIATLALLTFFIDLNGNHNSRYLTSLILCLSAMFIFFIIQSRSTLFIFSITFIISIVFLILSRFKGVNRFSNLLWQSLFPTKLANIAFSLLIFFFIYSTLNISFFNTTFGASIPQVTSFISNAENCAYMKMQNCEYANDEVPLDDVSILVRTLSDYVFLDSFLKAPSRYIFPISFNQTTNGSNYMYRTHNLLIFWTQRFGILGTLSLFYTFYIINKFLTSYYPLYLSPLSLPILTLSIFTLNDFFILLPFTIYLPSYSNHE